LLKCVHIFDPRQLAVSFLLMLLMSASWNIVQCLTAIVSYTGIKSFIN